MSHYSVYKTKIGHVSADLLNRAIRSLAEQINAEVITEVKDYYGATHKVLVGLKTVGVPRGIGFGVDENGNLTVHGDEYDQSEFNKISTLAQNYVKAYKVAQTARMAYPTANIQIKPKQKEVILEVVV